MQSQRLLRGLVALATGLGLFLPAAALAQAPAFVAFETGPVRPLALSADGSRLVAVNTPDGNLEVFEVSAGGLSHSASIPVGMEPCAVVLDASGRAWVVNHLSDSVSVVDLSLGRVVRSLLVGDEPRDVVITDPDGAGPLGERAFVTTAHRGQQRTDPSLAAVPGAGNPQLTTAGVGRADVWVFDVASPGAGVGGVPLAILTLFGDTPRALAVSPDGETVYAAVFHSGNRTAVVSEGMVCDGFGTSPCSGDGVASPHGLLGGQLPGGNPGPATNHAGEQAPEVGLVVRYDATSGEWRDELGRNWSNGLRFQLPDLDVFALDAATLGTTQSFAGVGTILFNMAVNPVSGVLYISNTDASNLTRFEGPGVYGGSTVQGNLAQAGITVIQGGSVLPRHLNKHIDYATTPALPGTKDHSLATPLDMAIDSLGQTLYVAAFGSAKVGVFATGALESDSFDPSVASAGYIPVSGGGPAGLALDEANDRLYVLTRFDNSVSVVDLATASEVNHIPLHNPEPPELVAGRPFLYDAFHTSSNGEASCSSCHVFGDMDSLAWDLGNPDDDVSSNPQQINLEAGALAGLPSPINGTGNTRDIHPMKGPMTTQTLRGMRNSGHMHWRGDRANGFFGVDDPPTNDSRLSFKNFIVAFPGLVGDTRPPTDPGLQAEIELFADFALALALPPNPVRALDNGLTTAQQVGRSFFLGNVGASSQLDGKHRSDGVPFLNGLGFTCEGCHRLDPAQGFFGTGGAASFENEVQIIKIPHLRNLYQKVGMFGMPNVDFNLAGDASHQGDQVRSTGFLHDGSTDTLFRFFLADVFESSFFNTVGFDNATGNSQRSDVEAFMLAFDTDLAPIVGQQVTLTASNEADLLPRLTLLVQRANAGFVSKILGGSVKECDLAVKGRLAGEPRGWLYDPATGLFESDRAAEPLIDPAGLRALAATPGQELTWTCVPPGSGARVALDRDLDAALDADERDAATDPANPGSVTGACADALDNDGDGAVDLVDPGCADAAADIENPQCSDGFDNDNDGLADAADPQCSGKPWKNREKQKLGCGLLGVEPLGLLLLRRRRGAGRHGARR